MTGRIEPATESCPSTMAAKYGILIKSILSLLILNQNYFFEMLLYTLDRPIQDIMSAHRQYPLLLPINLFDGLVKNRNWHIGVIPAKAGARSEALSLSIIFKQL